jgi:large subunit ribosomal protein L6
MSRIGKKPILLPENVVCEVKELVVIVHGPKGRIEVPIHRRVQVSQTEGWVDVRAVSSDRECRALHGLTRSLLANAVEGVSRGFEKRLEIYGTGYRVDMEGKGIRLSIGLSHPVSIEPPPHVEFVVESPAATNENPARVLIRGIDKATIGQVAATIRAIKPPEPYKGKGIRYSNEFVRRKAGKAAA